MASNALWTGDLVADRLVEAFRLLPSHPVFSQNGRFRMLDTADAGEVLSWPDRFVSDAWARRVLMTWARCRATGESVRERYQGLGWSRSPAERRRRAALAEIAAKLNERLTTGPDALDLR